VSRSTRGSSRVNQGFAYGAITHYGRTFQTARLPFINPTSRPHNPETTEVVPVWANPRSLATTYGITIVFFSCGYLDVSVPRVRLMWLCIHHTMTGHYPCRVSPFGHPRIKARLTAPRGFSQFTASFIASLCLGIHRTPLVA
jgi:hypothetical protein